MDVKSVSFSNVNGNNTSINGGVKLCPATNLNGSCNSNDSLCSSTNGINRVSAEEMDEKRQQHIAYEYLCHLEEAKKWIESCIREELPPATECEENLRNGIYLAKLSNFFCPEKVPFKKIYDKDQSRYQANGLHFRHTDNINHWFNAMEHIGLPKIFFPETTDIYDKKNMPRVVYCLHALSLYLFKLGIAPQIQDLYGVAKFTEEEITNMARELQKYGLQLPAFSKIGGILANEMPVDEAALHAAILAINDAIEKRNLETMLNGLKLMDAHLYNVHDSYIHFYHEVMHEAKLAKSSLAKTRSNDSNYIPDVYDELLTQAEIQGYINKINVDKLIIEINECINQQDSDILLKLLKSKASPFKYVIDKNADWYMAQLTQEKESKLSVESVLDRDSIQNSINLANSNAEKQKKCLKLLEVLNTCLINNQKEEFVNILKDNSDMFLSDIDCDYAGVLYFVEFKYLFDEKQSNLDIDDFVHGIKVLNVIVDINRVIDNSCLNAHNNTDNYNSEYDICFANDAAELFNKLIDKNAHMQDVGDESLKKRYLTNLMQAKQLKNNTNNNSIIDTAKSLSLSDSGHGAETDLPFCNLLTHGEIQDTLAQTNLDFEQECLAVVLINDSLVNDNIAHTLYLLKNSMPRDSKLILIDQNAYMYHFELRRLKNSVPTKILTIDDIRKGVENSNIILQNALNMTKTMFLINQVDETKRNEIISLIRDRSIGIKLNNDTECLEHYFQAFRELKRFCKAQPVKNTEWVRNRTIEDHDFYFSSENASIYSWLKPDNYAEATHLISRMALKNAIDATTEKYERNLLFKSNENFIVLLQSLIRGYLNRKHLKERNSYLVANLDKIVKIQAWWRMITQRNAYINRLVHFETHEKAVVLIQSYVRMWLNRKRYVERRDFFYDNEDAIIKIQSYVRARRARSDYISLINDKNPSIRVVRKFVHLLEHNSADFTEEIELQELKRQVITAIKMNKNLEQDLDMMDVKIGLLVKNRITLQDVLMQHKRLKKYKEDIESNQANHIKQLSKENHDKMELYQNLFYLLQTNPSYLAKLLFALPATNTSKFIESVVLQLFNYGANSREEYLLLKLFTTSLQQEIESKVDKISDIITGTPLVIKVIVSLYRKHRGENVLRNLLNSTIEEFLNNKSIQLCLNPSELYKNWINKLESDTGKASGYPYDITNQKALEFEEVRKQLDENIKTVKYYTSKFLHLILKSIDKIPYGLRYIAKVLKNSLRSKFPTASEREILKIIGNLIYYRFINSAICSPDVYDIIDLKAGCPLDSEQRKNLACIAKHLQLISMSKGYGDTENAHLSCLNPFIKESHEAIRNYFHEICNVSEADEYFGINEYSDLICLTKPIVYMTVQEICETHKILVEYMDKIAPDESDPLRQIFSQLQHEPNLESLGDNIFTKSGTLTSSPSVTSTNFNKNTQICLTLTNRFTPSGDEKTDLNNLFIRTKRFIVEIIHCQSGENLKQILKTPATPEQEYLHQATLKKREKNDKLMNPEYQRISKSLCTTLENLKREVRQNLVELEKAKMVSSSNNYQIIISRIAQDIRNQRKHRQRRQKELSHLKEVHKVLEKKHNMLKEQVSYYNEYVKACLDSFNSKKGRSKNPFRRSKEEKVIGTIKYSAAKLYDKGVILEIEGLQLNQFKNVLFEISTTEEPGIFEVSAKFMGVMMEKVELVFQDLLQMQYEGASIMKMFDRAKINVNLLIFLLNKKFYGK